MSLGIVVTAAGYGRRLGLDGPKQYVDIAGKSMLARTVERLDACPAVDVLVVVVNPEDVAYCREQVIGDRYAAVVDVVAGDRERSLSVRNGLAALAAAEGHTMGGCEYVGVHDGARPFVSCGAIEAALTRLDGDASLAGVVVGLPSSDTVKLADETGVVVETPPRQSVWRAQTPQIFRSADLMAAYDVDDAALARATDDASLVEAAGGIVVMVEGNPENIKVTGPQDLEIARMIAADQEEM